MEKTLKKFKDAENQYDLLKQSIYIRCKQLGARIAVVGSKSSAQLLLEAIDNKDIPIAGIFEADCFKEKSLLNGRPVQPIDELSVLDSGDVVVIASSREATDLHETFERIQSVCSCKTLHLKALSDIFLLMEELRAPLDYQFHEFLFGRGLLPQANEYPYWHPIPPGIDFTGKTVLELGPFEGNNSVMIMGLHPKKVIGVEARPVNFAKISVIKSLYGWENYRLVLGDMHLFPQLVEEKIDIIFCSGVFYHSAKPWWLLETCLEHCDTLILCGHVSSEHSHGPRGFVEVALTSGTYQFEVYPEIGDNFSSVTGQSLWFKEEDLIHFLAYHGFHYEKYDSMVNETGLWVFSVVTKK